MKKVTLLFALVLASVSVFGQGIVEQYYTDLEAQEKTTSIYVSSAMFKMAGKLDIQVDDPEFNEMKDFIETVQSFSLIKVPELGNPMSYFKEGISKVSNTHEELVRIKDEDTRLSVFVDEQDDVIYEVAVLGVVDGDFLAASLVGEMSLDQVSSFINKAQGDSFEGLSAIRDAGVADMKVYPNPTARGAQTTVEVPAKLVGGKAMVYSMDGELLMTIPTTSTVVNIDSADLPAGGYVVELQHEGVSIKQKMIVVE